MFKNDRDCGGKMENYYEMGKEAKYETAAMPMGYGDMGCCDNAYPGVVCPPIYECPQERVCHRYICHEVPQE